MFYHISIWFNSITTGWITFSVNVCCNLHRNWWNCLRGHCCRRIMSRHCHQAWRRHQMKIFSALLALCAGNSPVTGEPPSQRPVTRSFAVSFDLRLNKHSSKQAKGCCLRRHRAHYDITVLIKAVHLDSLVDSCERKEFIAPAASRDLIKSSPSQLGHFQRQRSAMPPLGSNWQVFAPT